MRRSTIIATVVLVALYAWPMLSALELRQALRSGNAERLEPCVDWPTLRENLKSTVRGNLTSNSGSSWFRRNLIERAVPALADRAIDAAVTPSQLAWFLRKRMEIAPNAEQAPQADAGDDEIDVMTSPRRLRYAFFESPTRFRIEASDPKNTDRRLVAILSMQGLRWRLTNVAYVTRALPAS